MSARRHQAHPGAAETALRQKRGLTQRPLTFRRAIHGNAVGAIRLNCPWQWRGGIFVRARALSACGLKAPLRVKLSPAEGRQPFVARR